MSLSIYDVSVPVFRQILAAFSGVLAKADAHCAAGQADESTLTSYRLYEDMLPFTFQVQQTIAHSAGAVAKLAGGVYPKAEGLDTFAGCKAAVDAAIASLDAVKPTDLEGSGDKDVVFQTPHGAMPFVGRDYLLTFALPNFFFHATTAYAILRHQGVPIGKSDFIGAAKLKTA